MTNQIFASLLAADFSQLSHEIEVIEKSKVDGLHLDMMDGVFVDQLSFGPLVLKAIRSKTKLPIDVHLMVQDPEKFIPLCADYGADTIYVHVENNIHLHRTLSFIKSCHKKVGIVLNPVTPLNSIDPVLEYIDEILLMSVNPGWGGQAFIESTYKRVEGVQKIIQGSSIILAVDGGVNDQNAAQLQKLGAQKLIAGSYLFKEDMPKNVQNLRGAK